MAGVKEMGGRFDHLVVEPARAKLFTHGGSQAVRLPKAFRFEGKEVVVRKEGDRVILEPVRDDFRNRDWDAFWAKIDQWKTGNPEDDDWPDLGELRDDLLPPKDIDLDADD